MEKTDTQGMAPMKLAEALNQRADLKRRIAELSERLKLNAKVQEGDSPAEEPAALLCELRAAIAQYMEMIARINRTNSAVAVDGETVSDMLARRDALSLENSILRGFLAAASDKTDRYSLKEIRIVSTVDVAALRRECDAAAKALRELDTRIQQLNWNTDLM